MRFLLRIMCVFIVAIPCTALSQAVFGPAQNYDAIPRPPVPADPLELAAGSAQPIQDAEQRIAVVSVLNRARDLSNVRAQPYDLKTTFVSSGGLSSDGNWTLEDVSAGRAYRWTAQGPGYSVVNLYPDSAANGLYSSAASGTLPLRLTQVREAIFFIYPVIGPQTSVRATNGVLDGIEQHCLLIAANTGDSTLQGGRNWGESEYCMDAATGLLTTYSVAPGIFVKYDYSSHLQFHGKIIPTGFTISEAGRPVAEARTLGVSDPPAAKDSMFSPAGLTPAGVGRTMNPTMRVHMTMPVPGQQRMGSGGTPAIQIVVLHGSLGPTGQVSDVEIVASTDPDLNPAAMQRVKAGVAARGAQPGAKEQSQEVVVTLEFVTTNRR